MSQNSERKILRGREKDKLKEIHNTYNRKPKEICPKCHKKSLFMTNSKNEVFCIRCNNLVEINK